MFNWLIGISEFVTPAIIACAVLCGVALVSSLVLARKINKGMTSKNEKAYKETTLNWISFHYNAFVVLVSIFPLLGMLGTVLALWGLDLNSGATEDLKQQFFLALDTTAAGLFFSIFYKAFHAAFQTYIENAISQNEEMVKTKEKEKRR